MHRQNGNKTYGDFNNRASKTERINKTEPRRGGIRL